MCGFHRDNDVHDQMSAYAAMKAQKDQLLQREREALERPLLAQIDDLRLENKQLSEDLRHALSTTMIQNLNAKIATLEADRNRLLLACKESYKLPRPWMVVGNISWPEWDAVWLQLEQAINGR